MAVSPFAADNAFSILSSEMTPSTRTTTPVSVGMDIGGSHATAALHDAGTGELLEESLVSQAVDSAGDADSILDAWAATLRQALTAARGHTLTGIGIAMPGPFDYDHGISRIRGLAKYDALYGMNVRVGLKARLGDAASVPLLFRNDASCFLLGESWSGAAKGFDRAIGITLGTGFGSAFMAGGELVESGPEVPANGWLYECPFRGLTAEEWFSGRGLLRIAAEAGTAIGQGTDYPSLREYADAVRAGSAVPDAFECYGRLMGEFLAPWVARFAPECLVVGGNISRAMDLFAAPLRSALGAGVILRASHLLEQAALTGAASLPMHYREPGADGSLSVTSAK